MHPRTTFGFVALQCIHSRISDLSPILPEWSATLDLAMIKKPWPATSQTHSRSLLDIPPR